MLRHFLLKCRGAALEFRVEPGILVGDSQLCRQGRRQALVLLVEGVYPELIGKHQTAIHAYRRGNGNAEKGVYGRVARWEPQRLWIASQTVQAARTTHVQQGAEDALIELGRAKAWGHLWGETRCGEVVEHVRVCIQHPDNDPLGTNDIARRATIVVEQPRQVASQCQAPAGLNQSP